MHKKEYDMNITSTSGKVHKYKLKHVFGIKPEDLIQEFGAEVACKMLKFYGGTNMYIPVKKKVIKRIEDEQIRQIYEYYKAKGATENQVIEHIMTIFSYSHLHIRRIVGKTEITPEDKEIFTLKRNADITLLKLVSNDFEIFKQYGIVNTDVNEVIK